MRGVAIVGSLVLHAGLAAAGVTISERAPKSSAAVKVTIVHAPPAKPAEAPKPTDTAKPVEPPKPAKHADAAKPAKPAEPANPKHAEPAQPLNPAQATRAPVDTGVRLSNLGGDGPAAAPVDRPAGERKLGDPKPAALAKPKTLSARAEATPAAAACEEPATKPSPLERATEIEYPLTARENGIEGRLILKITVGEDGRVEDVAIEQSVEASLDAAAVAAVKTWRFEPARRCGAAIRATYTLARRFELGD